MTDITKEKEFYDRHGYEAVMTSLMEEEIEIRNKRYLISVLHLMSSLKDLTASESYQEIKIQLYQADNSLFFELKDNNDKPLLYEDYTDAVQKVAQLLRALCVYVNSDPALYSRTNAGAGHQVLGEIALTPKGLRELQKELLSPALQISLEKMNLNNEVAQPQLVNKQEPKMKI